MPTRSTTLRILACALLAGALTACGGGGSAGATAGNASVTGVSMPASVSVVTATHTKN